MLSKNRFTIAVATLLISSKFESLHVQPAEFKQSQLQELKMRQAQTEAMLALFDDKNFEKEFVDTTDDHDTMPLNEDQQSSSSFEGEEAQKSGTITVEAAAQDAPAAAEASEAAEESLTEAAARAKKELEEAAKKEEKAEKSDKSEKKGSKKADKKEEEEEEADDKDESDDKESAAEETEAAEEKVAVKKAKQEKELKKNSKKSIEEHKKKKVFAEDAFGDDKEKKTVKRDPKKVQREIEQIEKTKKSIDKISANLEQSKKALEKHIAHVKELKEVVKQQNDGSAAKAELDNVLINAQKHVTDLEAHIKKGEKLIDEKEEGLRKLQVNINATNVADVQQATLDHQTKKIMKDEKKEQKAKELSQEKPSEKPKQKPIQEVTIKEIKQEAVKAQQKIEKNEVKALKAESKAKELLPEVKKAKLQVKKLEALTAQTKEGSPREEKMKNFTAKAKERLADVESKVNKQISKELKAKNEITKSVAKIEKAKEDYKEKKEDLQEEKEAKLSSEGRIHSKPGSVVKPKHEVEGQNAIDYLKYVNQSQEAHRYYHTTPYDEREWHDPKKEVFRDPEYTDADKHKTKKPIKIQKKIKSIATIPSPKMQKQMMIRKVKPVIKPQVMPQHVAQNLKQQQNIVSNRQRQVVAVPAPAPTPIRRMSIRPSRQIAATPLNVMEMPHHPAASLSTHETEADTEEKIAVRKSAPKHKKKAKHHKKSHKKARKHRRAHKKARRHHSSNGLTQTQSAMMIQKKVHSKKNKSHAQDLDKQTPSKEDLMKSPQIQQVLQNNNKYWEQKMDSTLTKFKKKIEKVQRLYQKDENEIEKEHKAFLKKMKKVED